jgi:hypothetical protein
MPEDYVFEEAHPDLFKLAEFVLLSPFEKNILDGWIPSRQPGFRPGLAFSGGVDSTAAMALLPEQTLLLYHERTGFESILDHSNALRFFEHLRVEKNRPVVTVLSNHELVRTLSGKSPGFATDYACAVHVILLADHFGLDSIATGMPLENAFLWHGQGFREFEETWFWKRNAPLFESVGLQILQPVMGCSEIINRRIVEASGFGSFAQSCLRAQAGESCGECWKCFRKNSILGEPIRMSREIETFLSEDRLKMAAGTIYSIQKMEGSQMYNRMYNQIMRDHPHLQEVIHADVSFLEEHYEPALNLIPERYRHFVKRKLGEVAQPIAHLELIESFNMYDIHD